MKLNKKKQKSNLKKKKNTVIPVYDMSGKSITPEKKKKKKKILLATVIIALVAAFIYAPQFILKDSSGSGQSVEMDNTGIRLSSNALRDNPTADFDGDGIENAEETSLKTDPWRIDSDGDGATDYCEVHITNTNPNQYEDVMVDEQTKQDEANDKNVGSPYKIGNVILWADDYDSKAHGSVVKTISGYRFCNFNGFAQFPEDEGSYAYRVKDGARSLMEYREDENVWKINSGDTVELYDEKLTEIVEFSFFSHPIYIDSNKVLDVIAKILPDKGFITATKKMDIDVEPDTRENVLTDIEKPVIDSANIARFTANTNTLNDLQFVRTAISEDDSCIAVSLFNSERGEYMAIIYGYTYEGDLLLADIDTLEPIGTLNITEMACKIMDENGSLASNEYFDFSGFGFDSTKGDRISFFAASSEAVNKSNFGMNVDEDSDEDEEDTSESDEQTEVQGTDAEGTASESADDTADNAAGDAQADAGAQQGDNGIMADDATQVENAQSVSDMLTQQAENATNGN